MSANEVVGLVLAVLPLVIQGLDAYPDSLIVKFLKAREERRQFVIELMSIQSGVRFAIERLLIRLDAKLTPDQWRALRAPDVKGSVFFHIWEEILKENPSIIESNTMKDIKFVLDEMAVLLVQLLENTSTPNDAGLDVLRKIVEQDKNLADKTFSITKDLANRFKFVRGGKRRRQLIVQMKKYIDWLDKLNSEEEAWKPTRTMSRNMKETNGLHGEFLQKVRCHCENLYHALSSVWQCKCHRSPYAMLKLEKRKAPKEGEKELIRFSLFLTFELSSDCAVDQIRDFRETEIFIHHKSKKKTVTFAEFRDLQRKDETVEYTQILEPVEDICESLQNCLPHTIQDRLFFVLDENRRLREYFPPDTMKSCVTIGKHSICLEELLSRTRLHPFQSLCLATKLASSLLQLYATPWLPQNWYENSVQFLLHKTRLDADEAYVVISLEGLSETPRSTTKSDSLNPYLVGLGIILLELSEGKSFAQWVSERKDISVQTSDIQDKASVAWKWAKEDARLRCGGPVYRKVIERCLGCSFTSTHPLNHQTLDSAHLREAIYDDVVHPLEKIFNAFTNPLELERFEITDK